MPIQIMVAFRIVITSDDAVENLLHFILAFYAPAIIELLPAQDSLLQS
jgi:hypothetical protein